MHLSYIIILLLPVARSGIGVTTSIYSGSNVNDTNWLGSRSLPSIDVLVSRSGVPGLWGMSNNFTCIFNSTIFFPAVGFYEVMLTATATTTSASINSTSIFVPGSGSRLVSNISVADPSIGVSVSVTLYVAPGAILDIRVLLSWHIATNTTVFPFQYSPFLTIPNTAYACDDAALVAGNVAAAEAAAVLALYTVAPWTGGMNVFGWRDAAGSTATNSFPCSWVGVACSFYTYDGALRRPGAFPVISGLFLSARGISGTLSGLAALNYVEIANFDTNPLLVGFLPPFQIMRNLVISRTGVSLASIPSTLSTLQVIVAQALVGSAASSDLDISFSALSALVSLDISSNSFSLLGSPLCNCTSLQTLSAGGNRITRVAACLPASLGNLTTWSMAGNSARWSVEYGQKGALVSLRTANFGSSGLVDLADSFFKCPLLSSLVLTSTPFSGFSSSMAFANLSSLTSLQLTSVNLSGWHNFHTSLLYSVVLSVIFDLGCFMLLPS
jgi:hypothetical protein